MFTFLQKVLVHFPRFSFLLMVAISSFEAGAVEDGKLSISSAQSVGSVQSPRVRLKLNLKPYGKVRIKSSDGSVVQRSMAKQKMEHVLRARMDSSNHFYVADFHIETIPVRWVKSTGKYSMQINIYKRFGSDLDSIEEKVASTKLDGMLVESTPNLYSFLGKKEESFSSINGEKTLDLIAGFSMDELEQNSENVIPKAYTKLEKVEE